MFEEGGQTIKFTPEQELGDQFVFRVVPNEYRDAITAVKINDYFKTNQLTNPDRDSAIYQKLYDDVNNTNSDFYNVSLSMVVRRMPKLEAEIVH